jgi:hypothetical protein
MIDGFLVSFVSVNNRKCSNRDTRRNHRAHQGPKKCNHVAPPFDRYQASKTDWDCQIIRNSTHDRELSKTTGMRLNRPVKTSASQPIWFEAFPGFSPAFRLYRIRVSKRARKALRHPDGPPRPGRLISGVSVSQSLCNCRE